MTLKIILISCWSFMGAIFLFSAIATSIMVQNILPAVIVLIPIAVCVTLAIVTTIDMNKAYVQIEEDTIIVVDYYLFSKKEKSFKFNEIQSVEIHRGSSLDIRGYRYRMMGFSYIVFRNENNKYLFKIIKCPETNEFFSNFFEIHK